MATGALRSELTDRSSTSQLSATQSYLADIRGVLSPLASLKFTVARFCIAIFLILAGTSGASETRYLVGALPLLPDFSGLDRIENLLSACLVFAVSHASGFAR